MNEIVKQGPNNGIAVADAPTETEKQVLAFEHMANGANDVQIVLALRLKPSEVAELRAQFNQMMGIAAPAAGAPAARPGQPTPVVYGAVTTANAQSAMAAMLPDARRRYCAECSAPQTEHERGEGVCVRTACRRFTPAEGDG